MVGFIIYQLLRIGLVRGSVIGQTQQVDQSWKTWIQVKQLAAAVHLDAITFPVSTEYARFGVDCQLLQERYLPGRKLGSERFQNRAEILINHRREVRLVVAGEESAERRGASQRGAACVSLQCGEQQRARRRHKHISVREGVIVLGRKATHLRLDRIEGSSTNLRLIECYLGLVFLLRVEVESTHQFIYGHLQRS